MPRPRHPSTPTSRSSRASTPRCSPPCSSAAAPPASRRCAARRSRRPGAAPNRSARRSRRSCPAPRSALPGVGDAAARAAEPEPRDRRAPPRGARRASRAGRARRRSWSPRRCAARSSRSPPASPTSRRSHLAVGGRGHDLGRGLGPARRARVSPRRHGLATRRVRAARRHPRRLPADRRPPVPRRVLRRRGRPDPRVLGRRPALAAGRGARGRPRRRAASCCSPRRCASAHAS